MKRILAFLIIFCITSFSGIHTFNHIKISAHADEFHSDELYSDHENFKHEHSDPDTQESHHTSFHQHLDNYFVRSARQNGNYSKSFVLKTYAVQEDYFNFSEFALLQRLKPDISTSYCYNTPFIFSNQPLLIYYKAIFSS